MSGIAASIQRDGHPGDPLMVARMLEAAPHRGPDGFAYWADGPAVLGHAQLRTTPQSLAERQPLADKRGELHVVLDGTLDNRDELAAALGDAVPDPDTAPDAAFVLEAYRRWEEECPRRLLGDFAFALWDRRQRRLLCARDVVGVRPLYYRLSDRAFWCASEPRQLLAVPGCDVRPNPGMVGEYLCERITSVTDTLYEGIFRLAPAHLLTVSEDGMRVHRYYDPDPAFSIRYATDDQYADHLHALFREAVACRLRSHAPVGISLSGGVDSSAVLGMAATLRPSSVRAYALTYTAPAADERGYLQDVLAMWSVPSVQLDGDALIAPTTTEQLRVRPDFPDVPNGWPWRPLYAAAARDGVRVMLGGDGGDEWFTGSLLYPADLLRRGAFRAMALECRRIASLTGAHWLRECVDGAIRPLIPARVKRAARRLFPHPVPPWLRPDYAKRFHLRERFAQQPPMPAFPHATQRELYASLVSGAYAFHHDINNRLEAESGLEGRMAFHDRRLIEFALAIPEDQRQRAGVTKYVLRRAAAPVLPAAVRDRRTKAEFSHLFARALAAEDIPRRLSSLRLAEDGYLDPTRLRDLHVRYDKGDENVGYQLWFIMAAESWYRAVFAEGRGYAGRA